MRSSDSHKPTVATMDINGAKKVRISINSLARNSAAWMPGVFIPYNITTYRMALNHVGDPMLCEQGSPVNVTNNPTFYILFSEGNMMKNAV